MAMRQQFLIVKYLLPLLLLLWVSFFSPPPTSPVGKPKTGKAVNDVQMRKDLCVSSSVKSLFQR